MLIFQVGHFRFGITIDALMVALGGLAASVLLAMHFGRVRGR